MVRRVYHDELLASFHCDDIVLVPITYEFLLIDVAPNRLCSEASTTFKPVTRLTRLDSLLVALSGRFSSHAHIQRGISVMRLTAPVRHTHLVFVAGRSMSFAPNRIAFGSICSL
jgi:hypothetical protein